MTASMKEKYAEMFITAMNNMDDAKWKKPWVTPSATAPCNLYRKKKPYRRSNAFFLTMMMQLNGWETAYFVTKNQMKNEGGELKYKNLTANSRLKSDENGLPIFDENGVPEMEFEKRFPVIFWKPFHRDKDGNRLTDEEYDDLTDEEKDECKVRFIQECYLVYNIDQTNFKELYPDDYAAMTELPEHDYKKGVRDEVVERLINGEWRCPVRFGGHSAFYVPSDDYIKVPKRDSFSGDEAFYGTVIHEMAHSTAKELGRNISGSFGSEAYAMEELVAELTSACVLSMLGIGKLIDANHISYVNSWKKSIRSDKDFIPMVIDQMQKAVNYIMNAYENVANEAQVPWQRNMNPKNI